MVNFTTNQLLHLIHFVRANPFDTHLNISMRLSASRYDVVHIKFSLTIEQGISVDRLLQLRKPRFYSPNGFGSTRINDLTSRVEYLLSTATWAGSKCRNAFDHKVIVHPQYYV